MKAILFALFVGLLMVGCGDAQEEAIDLNDKGTLDEIIAAAIDRDKLQTRYIPLSLTVADELFDNWSPIDGNKLQTTYIDGAKTLAWEPDEQSPYTGWTKRMYDNGQINELWHYKDGKRNGLTIRWDEDGQKFSEEDYRNGKLDGWSTSWYENGQKREKRNFKDGKCRSAEVWKPNGGKCPETNVKDGYGVIVFYNEDGTEARRHIYKDGEQVED